MKTLKTIIRVRTWELEERRRRLNELRALKEKLETAVIELDRDFRSQQLFVNKESEMAFAYAAYAEAVRERRLQYLARIAHVEGQIEEAMAEVTEAYQELKKYEVALEARKRAELLERNRREQILLDDMAIESFRRKA